MCHQHPAHIGHSGLPREGSCTRGQLVHPRVRCLIGERDRGNAMAIAAKLANTSDAGTPPAVGAGGREADVARLRRMLPTRAAEGGGGDGGGGHQDYILRERRNSGKEQLEVEDIVGMGIKYFGGTKNI